MVKGTKRNTRLAVLGYVTYLRSPDQHTNAAGSHPGCGRTREESKARSRYWQNQMPWVVTVPLSRAPAWVRRSLEEFCP